MKPLITTVVVFLLINRAYFEETAEKTKNEPNLEDGSETETKTRTERCTTCTGSASLNIKPPSGVLSLLQTLPNSEVHSESSYEGCSSEKGCAGIKVKDGAVVEKYGNVEDFRSAAAADKASEFSFHAAGTFGNNIFNAGIPKQGPFWWMNENSPFKNVAAGGNYEKFSKSSSSSFTSNGGNAAGIGGTLDLSGNPFLNGEFAKNSGNAQIKPGTNYQSSFESSSFSTSNKGDVDLSKNPFLNGGFNKLEQSGSQFGAQAGLGNRFAGTQNTGFSGAGFVGSSPSPFTASTAGSNVNLIQNSQKNDFEYQQSQNTGDAFQNSNFQSSGGFQASGNSGEFQQTCTEEGYACVQKSQCSNGIVSSNGAGLQAKNRKQYCNTNTEVCCRIQASNAQSNFNQQGSFGSNSFANRGSFGTTGAQGAFGSQSGTGTQFGSSGSQSGNKFGSSGSHFGSSGTQTGQTGTQFGASGSQFGSSTSRGSASGTQFTSSGSQFGSSGTQTGVTGQFGSGGSKFGQSGTQTGSNGQFGSSGSQFGSTQTGVSGQFGSSGTQTGSNGQFGSSGSKSGSTVTQFGSNGAQSSLSGTTQSGSNSFGSGSNLGSVNRGAFESSSGSSFTSTGSFGSTQSPFATTPNRFGSTGPGLINIPPKNNFRGSSSQSNFIETDSFSSGSESTGVFRPGSPGSGLKPGIPYLPPVDSSTASNTISSTALPPTYLPPSPTTFRPTYTTAKPTYLPPSTSAPGYLPPVGEQSIHTETRIPPNPTYVDGGVILDETRLPPQTRRPPIAVPSEIPSGCAAALKCTPIEYCTAEGVISTTTVILTRDQDAFRVPLTDCKDLGSGLVGKCCRDPTYTDPWPTNQLGRWVPGVFGGDDGKYTPDSSGSANSIRPQVTGRPPVTGSVLLNNFRTPKPTGTPFGPNQVTPGYQGTVEVGQKGQFEIRDQGQYAQKGQGQFTQTSQGQITQTRIQAGGQAVSQAEGQGQFGQAGQTQFGQAGQFGQTGQGQISVTSKSQFGQAQGTKTQFGQGQIQTGVTQGTKTQFGQGQIQTGVTQGTKTQFGQGQIQTGQGQFGLNSQGQFAVGSQGQYANKGLGQIEIQEQGVQNQFRQLQGQKGVSQTKTQFGQGQIQTGQGQFGQNSQGQLAVSSQGQYTNKGLGQIEIQEQGVQNQFRQLQGQKGVSQTKTQFGQGQIQTGQGQFGQNSQGQFAVGSQGQYTNKGLGQIEIQEQGGQSQFNQIQGQKGVGQTIVQGEGQAISQGFGTGITQGQGFAVRQGSGFAVENQYAESNLYRVILQQYSAGGQCGILNGQKPNGNRDELEVDFAEIPWQAMVLLQTNRSLLCGGVITRPDVVLTSASCVQGLQAKNVLIKGGEWKLGIDEEPLPFQIVQVKHILRHPEYQDGRYENDVAILVLTENLRLSKNIYPICLPGNGENLDAFYNGAGECLTSGWGKQVLQANIEGSILHSISLNLINPNECQSRLSQEYPHLLSQYDSNSCACARPANPSNNLCKVDTGSALACSTGDGRYVLRGVYSWDSGCQPGNQIGAFYRFDLEWYQWAIGLSEGSGRFAQYAASSSSSTRNGFANQINTGIRSGIKESAVKGVSGEGASFGISGGSTGFGNFGLSGTLVGTDLVNRLAGGSAYQQSSGGNAAFAEIKAPITNSFSSSYTEKKVYKSEPKIITYTTKPEIITYTTKPEIFTYTTKPKLVTYTTKPQIITYETSGSGQNPQYVAPGVTYNPRFGSLVAKHDHTEQCKCLENGKK